MPYYIGVANQSDTLSSRLSGAPSGMASNTQQHSSDSRAASADSTVIGDAASGSVAGTAGGAATGAAGSVATGAAHEHVERFAYDANGNRTRKVVRLLTHRSGNARAHASYTHGTARHADASSGASGGGESGSSESGSSSEDGADGDADADSSSSAATDDSTSDTSGDKDQHISNADADDAATDADAQHVQETVDYIYDTDNRLMVVRDHEGLLFAALYDGDNNRVFTASLTTATHEYQLFKRKSPQTSAMGEGLSAFWYALTQQVVQFVSGFTTSAGFSWIATFDAVEQAWHRNIAKDRANREGLVVHPPSADNLPGEQPVEYASQVQGPLIPYTTKSDTYHYFEVRNYVNDTNREFAQTLQTTDLQRDTRTSYVYAGDQRISYEDEQSADTYQYLTDIRGSVTGLTHHGQLVASSQYMPFGSSDSSMDSAGAHSVRNAHTSFAYAGEARDSTGLDYLRARYYDSEVGRFISEDSIQGAVDDAASWNRYAYVNNNPMNILISLLLPIGYP